MVKILLVLTVAFLTSAYAEDTGGSRQAPYEYVLASCLTCGGELGTAEVTVSYVDRMLKFCCLDCVGSFTKSPKTYISNLEEQIRISQRGSYPLGTCIVSGEALGSMGDAVEYVSGNTLVKFCCGACIENFEQNREQMLYKLREASQKASGNPK